MKVKYKLTVDVTFEVSNEDQFPILEKNLELLPEMAKDLGLLVDGLEEDCELESISSSVKKGSNRGRKRKTA